MKNILQIPHSHEAEQAILGAMLLDPSCIGEILSILSVEDFYISQHKKIFETINEMFIKTTKIDFVTLSDNLKKIFKQKNINKYLLELIEYTPSSANFIEYTKILKDKTILRKIILLSKDILEFATYENKTSNEIIEFAEQQIYSVANNKVDNQSTKICNIMFKYYKNLLQLIKDENILSGIKCGFKEIDETISGLNNSDLILIASRPGMGKTSLALNIAINTAINYPDGNIVIFQLEMSKEQLIAKILSSEAYIDSRKLKNGNLNINDWLKLLWMSKEISNFQIHIDDNPLITITEIKAKCRRIKNLKLIVIDYLQLMQTNKKNENRTQEISEISRSLKIMAKEFNIPIICLSQLSRALEQRSEKHKKPILSDLRESGAIEQDADIVMFIYREDYYNENTDNINIAEIIIAKNRHGPTNTVKLKWIPEYTKFVNISRDDINDN